MRRSNEHLLQFGARSSPIICHMAMIHACTQLW